MEKRWQWGSIAGIPFQVDSSWFIIVALVTIANASEINALFFSGRSPLWGGGFGLLMAILLFVSVLLHELGHSLVAKTQGISVQSITLFLFGGVAVLEQESETPLGAFAVAIAGPLVSISLWLFFQGISQCSANLPLLLYVSQDLGRINLFLAVFNLAPGLPLDGGQVLKALIWKLSGDRLVGGQWAALSGQGLGLLTGSLGLMILFSLGEAAGAWLAIIGWFIWRNALVYGRWNHVQKSLLSLKASQAMTRNFRVVSAQLSLESFAQSYLLADPNTWKIPFYATSEGRYCGLIPLNCFQTLERSEWARLTLGEIARPLHEILTVTEKSSLVDVINQLESGDDDPLSETPGFLTVLSPAGTVAGVIDRGDVVQALALAENWPLTPEQLLKIKHDGCYPSYLPLSALAKSLG